MAGKIGLQDTEFDPDIHNAVDFDFFDEESVDSSQQNIVTVCEVHNEVGEDSEIIENKEVVIDSVENDLQQSLNPTVENDIKNENDHVDDGTVSNVEQSFSLLTNPSVENEIICNKPVEESMGPSILQQSLSSLAINAVEQNDTQCENDDDNSDDSLSDSEQYSDSSFECDEQCSTNVNCRNIETPEKRYSICKDSLELNKAEFLDSIESGPETDSESIRSKPDSKFKQIVKLHEWTPTPDSSRTYVHSARSASAKRRKNMSFSNEEVRRIDRENMILLRRIFEQQRIRDKPKSAVPRLKSVLPKTTQQRKIDRENALLLRKIKGAKASKDIASAFGAAKF